MVCIRFWNFRWFLVVYIGCLSGGGRQEGWFGWNAWLWSGRTEGRGGDRKGVLEGVRERGSRGESEGVGSLEKWIEGKDKEKRKRKRRRKEESHPQCTSGS